MVNLSFTDGSSNFKPALFPAVLMLLDDEHAIRVITNLPNIHFFYQHSRIPLISVNNGWPLSNYESIDNYVFVKLTLIVQL